MADEKRTNEGPEDLRYRDQIGVEGRLGDTNYIEETSAEIAAPVTLGRDREDGREEDDEAVSGRGIGFAALALSIISLFVLPVLFGAAGIVLGFIARRRGAKSLGNWAIGLGIVSIIVGLFIAPFF